MSVYAYSYVWEMRKFKGAELLMMLALADFAHQDTGECFPSIPTLAKMLRVTDRNIQILLRRLEKNGSIAITEGKGQHTDSGSTNRYTLCGYTEWKQAVKDISSLKNKEVKVSSPKPYSEPSLEPVEKRKRSTPRNSNSSVITHPLILAWATVRKIDAVNIGAPIFTAKDLVCAKRMENWGVPPTADEINHAVKLSKVTAYPFQWLEQDIPNNRLTNKPKVAKVYDDPLMDLHIPQPVILSKFQQYEIEQKERENRG